MAKYKHGVKSERHIDLKALDEKYSASCAAAEHRATQPIEVDRKEPTVKAAGQNAPAAHNTKADLVRRHAQLYPTQNKEAGHSTQDWEAHDLYPTQVKGNDGYHPGDDLYPTQRKSF